MEFVIVLIVLVAAAVLISEYRIKKPGQLVLYESKGLVKNRSSRFYPRHLSLVIPNTTHTFASSVETEAKGKIPLLVKFTVTVTPSIENISRLVKIGGWGKNALADGAKELDIIIQGDVKEFTEKFEIGEINTEGITSFLNKKLSGIETELGLEILSLTIQSVEPADKKIAEAIRQKESSRILEETERNNQLMRIQTAQMKLKADEEILQYEHELEMKKFQLKEIEEQKEAELALKKLNEQVKRDKIKLDIENEEMNIFKNNPELLLLTPQVARLAEASQNLKNAKTVVSLGDIENTSQLTDTLKNFLNSILNQSAGKK